MLSIALAAAILAAPVVAHGATFFVDDDATQPQDPCTDPTPARACTAIEDAVEQARGTAAGPHTIQVAPGRYVEEVEITEPEDAGLTIEGSGAGGDSASPASDTIVEHADDDGFNDGTVDVGTPASGVAIRDLRVEVPSGAGFLNDPAIVLDSPASALRDVRAEVLEPTAGSAIALSGPETEAERVVSTSVTPNSNALIVGSFADDATVRDSVAVNGAGRAGTTFASDGVRIVRSVFSSSESSNGFFVQAGSVTFDSSLLVGGRSGLDATTATVTVRHATIDAGDSKVADEDDVGVQARADAGNTASISLFDSIVLEEQSIQQGGEKRVVCRRSDVPDQVEGAPQGTGSIDCPAAAGNLAGNQTSDPGDLFVPGAEDWRLRPGSPAVDRGLSNLPGGADSALDLDRNPRLADGDGDGVAATDMGAFELQPASEPSPPPSNEFEFVKVKRNKRKGTAKLIVRVPGPGELELLRTKKVKPVSQDAGAAGRERLLVRSRGKARKRLNAVGKARARAQVTYTPTGGEPNTKSKRIGLRKRR